ncbi:MAG TPA: hypothetical protein VG710_10590 [Opitutus sp.]|nr:hypothetical protein [Opitutus sp.]
MNRGDGNRGRENGLGRRCFFATSLRALAATLIALSAELAAGAPRESAAVFDGPPCPYEEVIARAPAGAPLRSISVEERVGVARHDELVRVPLFFAQGECPVLDDLVILPAGTAGEHTPVPWQADDIRRGPDGGISRVHLWFAVDLAPDEKRRFALYRRPGHSRAPLAPMTATTAAGEIKFEFERGSIAWGMGGELRMLELGDASCEFDDAGALPGAVIAFPPKAGEPAALVRLGRDSADRDAEWETGALFSKLRVDLKGPDGAHVMAEFRVPRSGDNVSLTTALFPGVRYGGTVKAFFLISGTPAASLRGRLKVMEIPAGIRASLRAEQAYKVSALAGPGAPSALLAIPLVIGGGNGVWRLEDSGQLAVRGAERLARGGEGEKNTLHAFWSQVRFVPAGTGSADEMWRVYRRHVQPLTAVVDEPGVTRDDLHRALRAVAGDMKAVGWRQEAGRELLLGHSKVAEKILERAAHSKEADMDYLVRGARSARDRITQHGERPVRDDEKGRAYGQLDPYHITYTQSVAAALAVLENAPAGVTAVDLAMARGVREVGGKVDPAGDPYIDCFSRTLNMQMGPMLFGLTAGAAAGDSSLVRFYRDLATAPPELAIFGRGQRPYTGAPTKTADETDFLYQAICDFWLRTAELLANEDLQLHPLAYGRYTDCIDVMADVYHGLGPRDKDDATDRARANFFRGQAHTHRWLGWSCAPFIRLLEDPKENASVGLTEAVRFARAMKKRWKNWPDLTFYILADLLVRDGLARYRPPALPPPVANVVVRRTAEGNDLSWAAVPGAAAYRIYRGRGAGGPYRWLNSPYVEKPEPPLTATHFHDGDPGGGSTYVVLAVDAAGRASAWR